MQLIFFLFHYIYQKISDCVIKILVLGLMSVNTIRKNLILKLIVRYLLTYPIKKITFCCKLTLLAEEFGVIHNWF